MEKIMRRFFGEKLNDNQILIKDGEYNHIKKVLRMKESDKLICYVNDEYEYLCHISTMNKDSCICSIDEKNVCEGNPNKNIVLFQMMPKKEYFDNILPKAIELGVSEIYFFTSDYTQVKNFKRERVDLQVMTACKQCERSKLVKVHDMIDFKKMNTLLDDFDISIFAYENETQVVSPAILQNKNKIAVIIGNEAGFSDKEAETLKKKSHSISLGKRILRCDTAVVATLSLVGILSNN